MQNKLRMAKLTSLAFTLLACVIAIFGVACGSSSSSLSINNGSYQLEVNSNLSAPLVNGQQSTYNVYIKNLGNLPASGLNFHMSEFLNQMISTESGTVYESGNATIDGDECGSIPAGSSCEITISTNSVGTIGIYGTINGVRVIDFNFSTYPLAVDPTADMTNALVLVDYPTTLEVMAESGNQQSNYYGSMDLFVINQYNKAIDVTNLFNNLPTGLTWEPINCPSLLPSGGMCQVRLIYNGDIGGDLTVNLSPSGSVNGTVLPQQQSRGIFVIKRVGASLSLTYPSLNLNGNNPSSNNTTTGFITNNGTVAATISSITIDDNTNNLFSISNNNCIGELDAESTCEYTITSNVGELVSSDLASGAYSKTITVNYNDGISTTTSSSQLNYSYVAVIPPANLSIQLGGVTNLTDVTRSGAINVENNSNVAIQLLGLPQLSGYTTGLSISDPNHCISTPIQVHGSCAFVVDYIPSGSNIDQVAYLSGINASYIDPVSGSSQNVSFNNVYGISITTESAATLAYDRYILYPNLNWTNSQSYFDTITLTNVGGSDITNLTPIVQQHGQYGELNVSGCNGTLAVNESCILTVTGNYQDNQTATYISNGIISVNYADTTGTSNSQDIDVIANVQMMPVVSPGLSITGIIPSSMHSRESQTIVLTLTNNTTATNAGTTAVQVNMDSLIQNIGANLVGSLNTTGITDNACSATSGNIMLGRNQSCVVNLVLMANDVIGTRTVSITPQYEYYEYTVASIMPSLEAAQGVQINSLSGDIDVRPLAASLELTFYTDNSYATPITNLSVEQSGTSTLTESAVLKITNTGDTALTSITMPSNIAGLTFSPEPDCSNLAPASSCHAIVSLSSASVINQTNIATSHANVIGFTYSNSLGNQSSTEYLPTLNYQVVAPLAPIITESTSFSGCGLGVTDTMQTCMLNPGSGSGTTGGYKFVVTYSNTSTSVDANNFTVIPSSNPIATNYSTTVTNGCNNITLSKNSGSCQVAYTINANSTSANISSGASLGGFSYIFGSSGVSSGLESVVNPNQVNVSIAQPSVSMTISSTLVSTVATNSANKATISATISNWYANNKPSTLTVTAINPSIASVGSSVCTPLASALNCTIVVTGLMPGTSGLRLDTVLPNNLLVSQVLALTVSNYFLRYESTRCIISGVSVIGACSCLKDPVNNTIWFVAGGLNSTWTTGMSLYGFNLIPHCGLTGGWTLPTAPNASVGYMSSTNPGGDWGDIATAAGMSGSDYNIGAWLKNNGFRNVPTTGDYWTANPNDSGSAWGIDMADGRVAAYLKENAFAIAPVHH